ncbi:hypothetical protein GCM10009665_38230 [Kitasatospora nipponensis]|uniref:Uncharacterized protein n=1 Tax=Kitasatospora nipponensis TaxID=258049 RepID=A0ABN1WHN5_9ACTN
MSGRAVGQRGDHEAGAASEWGFASPVRAAPALTFRVARRTPLSLLNRGESIGTIGVRARRDTRGPGAARAAVTRFAHWPVNSP